MQLNSDCECELLKNVSLCKRAPSQPHKTPKPLHDNTRSVKPPNATCPTDHKSKKSNLILIILPYKNSQLYHTHNEPKMGT